ncbi:MAG: Mrp/NBP35 family ATP-binding protein [Eubacteriales bacterium]|jgi:Mrp family chromosome partitioning ATPase|nr:Mrp/NBP35 family ATP-binding protein [Eubacteriales bacterium]MDD7573580.1 Mrp/NBP35 family ATP-binding protein [Eubacteriales bacterium]
MSEGCTHDCSTCSENCSSKQGGAPTFEKTNDLSRIKKTIAVVSGKGGVGKTLVSSMLAVELHRRELKTAIIDADVTGPSIPKAFGLKGLCEAAPLGGIMPVKTTTGIETVSVNLLLEDTSSPVLWRGPVIAGMVKQFWTDVIWGDVDVMVIDCPPGTGDVPLTVFQSIPVDGIIIVTSPQDLVSLIVSKAVNMARLMNIPIIGIVENMSYVECPDCGKKIEIFGKSHTEETAKQFGIPVLARIPVNPELASQCDKGVIELFEGDWMGAVADAVEAQPTRER